MKSTSIFIISPEAWGSNLLSKHYYALHLSKNNVVHFINPAVGYSRFPFGNMNIQLTNIDDNLVSVEYKNLVPRLNSWPNFLRNIIYNVQIKRIKRKIGLTPKIVWSFDPRRFTLQSKWKAEKSIYHSVDLHPNSDESTIARESDFVFALSDIILENLIKYNSKVKKIGHGCHIDTANDNKKTTLPGTNKIKAIYTGNFHLHVDYDLLLELSSKNLDCDFILVGPTAPNNLSNAIINKVDLDKLKNQANVFMLGSIPGKSLQLYLNSADICLVLFKKEFELVHHNPHKLMAYFASGKTILANPIDEYKLASKELICRVDQSEILNQFETIKSNLSIWNSEENQKLRKDFAQANSYELKIAEVFEFIQNNK